MANKKNYNKISTENAMAEKDVNPEVNNEVNAGSDNAEKVEKPVVTGVVVKCEKLNVRKSPSLNAEKICVINAGTEVTISSKEGGRDFYAVTLPDGTKGFCMKKYIKK